MTISEQLRHAKWWGYPVELKYRRAKRYGVITGLGRHAVTFAKNDPDCQKRVFNILHVQAVRLVLEKRKTIACPVKVNSEHPCLTDKGSYWVVFEADDYHTRECIYCGFQEWYWINLQGVQVHQPVR